MAYQQRENPVEDEAEAEETVGHFLDSTAKPTEMSDEQVLRTGVLFKKGSGMGPFGRKNWKPRYFVLTPTRLKYFTFEDGELKGELDISQCDESVLEVMPADSMKTGSSASTIWRIAINAPERRLLVAAGTEMEMNEWVDKLVMAFRINHGQSVEKSPTVEMHRNSQQQRYSAGAASPPMTDFQNFAGAMRRSSVGRPPNGFDQRASDEQRRSMERAQQRLREDAEKREQERLAAEKAARERKQREDAELQDALFEKQHQEQLLEQQRQQKREKHAKEREEARRAREEQEQQDILSSAFDHHHAPPRASNIVPKRVEYEVVRRSPAAPTSAGSDQGYEL